MTFLAKKELEKLAKGVKKIPEILPAILKAYDLGVSDEKDKERTPAQNKGLHKDCDMIAEKLNNAGFEIKQVIKLGIPFTMQIVKDYIWRPVMRKMYQKESTTELEKSSGEIEKIHDVIMRELGEKLHIEYHPFPHDPEKKKEFEQSVMGIPEKEYPTEHNDPDLIPF